MASPRVAGETWPACFFAQRLLWDAHAASTTATGAEADTIRLFTVGKVSKNPAS